MNREAIIWALIFFFIPFERFIKIPGTQVEWNALHILFWLTIIFLYSQRGFYNFKKIAGIKQAAVLSVVLSFIFFVGHATVQSAQRIFFIFAIIWATPLLILFIKEQRKLAVHIFIMMLTLHAIWAGAQFSLQKDLNLNYLGETNIFIGQPGIATFTTTDGLKIARAYGPYSHPNVLAGSLVLGLIIFSSSSSLRWKKNLEPVWLIIWYWLSLSVLFSFSRAAWLAYAILFLVSCKTLTVSVRNLILISTLIISVPLIVSRSTDANDVALSERFSGVVTARTLLFNHSALLGVGPGNYEHTLENYLKENNISYEPWHIAPVHNVPLLLLVEWGILPAVALTAIAFFLYAKKFRTTWPYLLPIIPLLLLDHYVVTQPAPLLYLVVVMLLLATPVSAQSIQKSPTAHVPTTALPPPLSQ